MRVPPDTKVNYPSILLSMCMWCPITRSFALCLLMAGLGALSASGRNFFRVPKVPTTTGTVLVLNFHSRRLLLLTKFSVSFTAIFKSPGRATSINKQPQSFYRVGQCQEWFYLLILRHPTCFPNINEFL